MSPAVLTVEQVYEALTSKYTGNGWCCFREFSLAGTMGAGRRADLVAMNCFASRGFEIHMVEVKARREDLLREIHDAAKADEIGQYADRIWVAVTDRALVDGVELPPGWGLYWPRGKQLITGKKAPKRDRDLVTPIDRSFVARMLLREEQALTNLRHEHRTDRAVRDARAEGFEQGRQSSESRIERLEESIRDFEKASGLKITGWNGGDLGRAVEAVQSGRHLRVAQRFRSVERTVEDLSNAIAGARKKLVEAGAFE